MKRLKFFFFIFFSGCFINTFGQQRDRDYTNPNIDSLMKSIGRQMYIAGTIYGGEYSNTSHVTILNLGDEFPNQTVNLIIKEGDLKNFRPNPILIYYKKNVSVHGLLEKVGGKLQIVVSDSSQIALPYKIRRNYKSQ